MSRKTSRNAERNARKKRLEHPARSATTSRITLSGLALGSLTFAVSGTLHAQNASGSGMDSAKAPQESSKAKPQARKRLGHPATLHLAASQALPPGGTGLVAQAANQTVPAPTSSADTLQEIVVTGIRGSLERALQIKRMSMGVVDAISAEDIGTFPDSSIGEAMQRIPGVSVSRGNSMSQGNSTIGNVTGVTVRGFGPDFSETLVDGRPLAGGGTGSGSPGRSIDFSSVGAEFVGEIDVHKTPDFSLSSGEIGATLNIKYPKPFDHPGMQARGFASETDNTLDGGDRPAFGALFSNTFAGGTFGILLDGDYTDHHVTAHHVSNVGWVGTHFNTCQMAGGPACTYDAKGNFTTPYNTFPSWFEQEYQILLERTDERRKDGRAVLQWHPADAVMVTLNDDYSDDRIVTQAGGFSNWFNGASGMSNVTQDANGTVTDFTYGPAPTDLDGAINSSYIKTNSYGLNVLWDVSDNWSAEMDASQSVAKDNPGDQGGWGQDVGFGPSSKGGTNGYTGGIVDTGAGNLLYPSAFGPNNDGNVYQPAIYGSHVDVAGYTKATDTVNQAKLDATWHHDSLKLNFGGQFVGDTRTSAQWTTFINGNNEWQAFAGYGPASNNTGGVALPASLFTGSFSTANFIPGWGNVNKLPPVLPWYSPYAVTAYEQSLGVGAANPGYGPTNGYPFYNGVVTPAFAPGSPVRIQEKSYAPFVTAEQNFDVGGMTLKANLGLRFDKTDVTTGGIAQLPTSLTVEAADHTAFVDTVTAPEFVEDSNSYHYLLPSLDLNLMVRPDLKVRFDASRTETKPPLNLITPTLNLTGLRVGALAASGNNPRLMPYLANNFDLGAEWYYASNDYVSVDAFFKHVSQFPVSQTVVETINGVMDPTTGQLAQWATTTYENGPKADVRGIEAGWQQMLKWGFGFQINGTYVKTNAPYNRYALTNVFALPGLSNEANFVGFYQRNGFQARVAVNWRGEELQQFGQTNSGGTFGTEPTFVNSTTEVDFSTSYDVTSHVSVFFEGLNLNNALYSTHGRFDNQMLDVVEYGPSLTLGVRAKM